MLVINLTRSTCLLVGCDKHTINAAKNIIKASGFYEPEALHLRGFYIKGKFYGFASNKRLDNNTI